MTKLQEHDAMICRSCGNEERASEGYPCQNCGTFICLICNFRGVTQVTDPHPRGRYPGAPEPGPPRPRRDPPPATATPPSPRSSRR